MAYLVLAGNTLDRAFAATRLGLMTARPTGIHVLPPGACAHHAEDLRCPDQLILEGLTSANAPIELFVSDRSERRRFRDFSFSVCPEEFPPGAFWELTPRILMYSPEQFFLYKCRSLPSTVDRVHLAMELCGAYACTIPGKPRTGCEFKISPATTAEKLRAYLDRAQGMYGVKKAREAAAYVIGNSYSPRETMVVMEQCLPVELGGRAYPTPELNKEVYVPDSQRHLTSRDWFQPDIYWEEASLDEEYEGRGHNVSEEKVEADKARLADIQALGIQVIPVTRKSLATFARSELLGRQVGEALVRRAYGDGMRRHLESLEDLTLMSDRQRLYAHLMALG